MSLCRGPRKDPHKSAFVRSSYLRWILGSLRFKRSLPHPDYIHRLVEHFRHSSSPESMRRVVFSPEEILCEYASASCHLPGAYAEFFPCRHCTDEEGRTSFVEVFHVANVHKPDVCATVTFTMPAFVTHDDAMEVNELTGCSVQVEFTKGCQHAPIAADHSGLEAALLVSRRWSDVIGRAVGSLQQRHAFYVIIKFYGDSPAMLSAYCVDKVPDQWRILRVLTTRGLSQALTAVHSHFRNAFVRAVFLTFLDNVAPPAPPQELLVDIQLPLRVNWLTSLLHSMPRNSIISHWVAQDVSIGFGNLPTLARCALKPHRKLGCVQTLKLSLCDDGATWAQLASLLNQPSIRGFNEVICSTWMSIDTSELCAILSSRWSPKLHLIVYFETEPPDELLTLTAQLIWNFVALRDVSRFATEFSLRLGGPDNVGIPEMPYVNYATDRRKRFRYHLQGQDTVVRVHVYTNRAARECLTVVTFDDFRRTVRFFKGNVSLLDLESTLQRPYVYY